MLMDDPKDPKDQPDEVELDEDADEESTEVEDDATEAVDEDEAGPGGDEDQAEESEEEPETEDEEGFDELPDDPKVLKRMLRQQRLQRETFDQDSRRQPPTAKEDPDNELAQAYDEVAKSSPAAAKLISHLVDRVNRAETKVVQTASDTAAMAKVPDKHQPHVRAIADRFGIPVTVAHSIYKGALYDRMVAKREAKRRTGSDEPAEKSRGKAPITRPVRRAATGGPGNGSAGTLVVQGMKLKTNYKPSEYEKLMDSLPVAKRKIVYALRAEDKIKVG